MNAVAPTFLPDRLRPAAPGRRSRRGFVVLSVVPAILLVLPMWRVNEVEVNGCPELPVAAVQSLAAMVGQPALGLDLQGIRDAVEVWPGVGEVQVDLVLPGTLRVRAAAAEAGGSVRLGRSWHGVGEDGGLVGVLESVVPPVLVEFAEKADRARGLAAARRVAGATGAEILEVRRVTPADYRLVLTNSDEETDVVAHVHPEGSGAEIAWCAAFARKSVPRVWSDLRAPDRMVLGGGR